MTDEELLTILMQKAKGVRNSCGDVWGDWVCKDAAARIEAQAALIAELTEALLIIRNDAELTSTGRTSFLGKIMRTADAAISKAKGLNAMSEFSGTYEQLLNAAKEMLRREERNTQSSILKALIEEVEAQAALIAELTEALRPFCFFDADHPKTDTTQRAWDIRYTDRFRDWIGFDDIEAARGALARAEEAQK